MSLILPDDEIGKIIQIGHPVPCEPDCTVCAEAMQLCQAQARHMAREMVKWIGREWDEQVYVDGNLRNLEAWLRQEGVLGSGIERKGE